MGQFFHNTKIRNRGFFIYTAIILVIVFSFAASQVFATEDGNSSAGHGAAAVFANTFYTLEKDSACDLILVWYNRAMPYYS